MFNKLSKRIRKLFNSPSTDTTTEERTKPQPPPKIPPRNRASKPQSSTSSEHKINQVSKPQASTSSEVHTKRKRVRHIVSDSDSDSESENDSDFFKPVRIESCIHTKVSSDSDSNLPIPHKSKTTISPKSKNPILPLHRFVKKDFKFFNAQNCSMLVKMIKVTDGDTFTVAFPVKLVDLMEYYSSTEYHVFKKVDMEKDEYTVLYFTIRSKGIDAYEKAFLPGQLATAYAYHILSPLKWVTISVGDDLPDKFGRVLASIDSGNKNLESCLLKGYNDLQTICRKAFSQLKPYDKRLNGVNFSDYDSWNDKPLAVSYDGGTKDIDNVEKSSKADKTIYNALILAIEKKSVHQLETILVRNKTRVKGVRNL